MEVRLVVGVIKETYEGERRVALTPQAAAQLVKAGYDVVVESGAGTAAGYPDNGYSNVGCRVIPDRESVLHETDVLAKVRACGADPSGWEEVRNGLPESRTVIGLMDPLNSASVLQQAAESGLTLFALELLPRITRAQSMDVLSSQANLTGYKAVLMAANAMAKIFPMMMTAAGTVTPSKVFVLGAGVAGLQAIATARRLGAVVTAYDVRPVVKEQVESLGARFAELPLEVGEAQDSGGYAKELGDDFYRRQAEMMAGVLAETDAVITTASVPAKKAPVLITKAMVEGMQPGSVIVDLAAERGGNCELTKPGETIQHAGVTIMGPLNLASEVAFHASQLYGKNVANVITYVVRDGVISTDRSDEIIGGTLVAVGGKLVHPAIRQILGLPEEE